MRNTFDRPKGCSVTWENQNALVSRLSRAGFLILAVSGIAAGVFMSNSMRGTWLIAVPAAFLSLWVFAMLWLAWRNVAVRSVTVDRERGQVTLSLSRREVVRPFTSVSGITWDRGLIWIGIRGDRGGLLTGRASLLAIYDSDLAAFVDHCELSGIPVTLAYGRSAQDYIRSHQL